jgi:hypothetical protein
MVNSTIQGAPIDYFLLQTFCFNISRIFTDLPLGNRSFRNQFRWFCAPQPSEAYKMH